MGYLHIDNLYKDQTVLLFKEGYALEKIHGTSSHITYRSDSTPPVSFFSGGAQHATFVSLFDSDALKQKFEELGLPDVTIYGEAFGGKMQGMSKSYGTALRFIAFDVFVGRGEQGVWLNVPNAADVVSKMGLEFVPYVGPVALTLENLDALRDSPSAAAKAICDIDTPREGIVIRPCQEFSTNSGKRVIAKHKGEAFSETAKSRKVLDAGSLEVLVAAQAIADEWVTEMRLTHVIDIVAVLVGLPIDAINIQHTGDVIKAMGADIEREAEGEIILSAEARKLIGKKTAQMFKARLEAKMRGTFTS